MKYSTNIWLLVKRNAGSVQWLYYFKKMCNLLKGLLFVICFCIVSAGFREDLHNHIQKTIAESVTFRNERISFCLHLPPPGFTPPDQLVEDAESQHKLYNVYFPPDILFWNPLSRSPLLRALLQCPREACSGKKSFLRAVGWKDGKTERDNPRRLYGLTSPVILVSRIYRCQLHKHEVIAHDGDVLMQLLNRDRFPFLLSHVTGMTREL